MHNIFKRHPRGPIYFKLGHLCDLMLVSRSKRKKLPETKQILESTVGVLITWLLRFLNGPHLSLYHIQVFVCLINSLCQVPQFLTSLNEQFFQLLQHLSPFAA
uniref:Uncharacterized protein MANES_08G145800 n=1 Tax=Rhizophora mucronata TaxID=61149 RepID=A0A2P2M1U1_RHIMU